MKELNRNTFLKYPVQFFTVVKIDNQLLNVTKYNTTFRLTVWIDTFMCKESQNLERSRCTKKKSVSEMNDHGGLLNSNIK